MKILLLSCSTGEGHNSAARAIAEGLAERGISSEIADPLNFKNGKAAQRAADAYTRTIRHAPLLFGTIYAIGRIYDKSRLPNPVYHYNAGCARGLSAYIAANGFTHVICTHLFAMHAVTAARRKCGLSVPLYGVLTDYTAIPFYKETALDGYFVSHSAVKMQLERAHVPPEKIFCSGIPVSPALSLRGDALDARRRLGIPEDKKIVALLSGGAGCGKILRLSRALRQNIGEQTDLYVFPAKNEKLRVSLEKEFAGTENVKIIPFSTHMGDYIKSADLILSKAGGLTVTEVATAGVALVILKSIPGCETVNRRYFCKNRLAVYAATKRKAAKAARRLMRDENAREDMRKKQREHILQDACRTIIEKISEEIK